jgi:ribose transport system substrate-binding protein
VTHSEQKGKRVKKKMMCAAVALAMTVLTGCTVGSDTDKGGSVSAKDQIFSNPNSELDTTINKAMGSMKGKRIAFVPILYKGYHLTENWGSNMKRTFEFQGAEFQVYDANFDPQKMVSTVDQLVRDKAADVLILHNIDTGLLTKQIENAEKAGIYVVVVNQLASRLGDAYIGINPGQPALDIAARAVKDCQAAGKKEVVVMDGPGNDASSIAWVKATTKVVEAAGMKVAAVAHSNYDNATARNATASLIQQNGKNLCAFLVSFDLNSISVGDAVKEAVDDGRILAKQIGVYTMAADAIWCDALRKGTVTASSAFDVPGVGSAAIAAVQQLIQMNQPAGTFHTVAFVGQVIVDQSNVDDVTSACYTGQ